MVGEGWSSTSRGCKASPVDGRGVNCYLVVDWVGVRRRQRRLLGEVGDAWWCLGYAGWPGTTVDGVDG